MSQPPGRFTGLIQIEPLSHRGAAPGGEDRAVRLVLGRWSQEAQPFALQEAEGEPDILPFRATSPLPTVRHQLATRRKPAGHHPYRPARQVEANLEQLVDELDREMELLQDRLDRILESEQGGAR